MLHVNDISPTDKPQRPDSGVIDHIAFGSRGFERDAAASRAEGRAVPVNEVPNSTRRQIFVSDPNNVLIELNFDVANEPRGRSFRPHRERVVRRDTDHRLSAFATLSANEARQRESRDVHFGRPVLGREAAGLL